MSCTNQSEKILHNNLNPNQLNVLRVFGRRGKTPSLSSKKIFTEYWHKLNISEVTNHTKIENLFSSPSKRYELEIGYGDGKRLATKLVENPDTAFIGIEPYKSGIIKLLKSVKKENTWNRLRLGKMAESILPILPNNCLDSIYILFPDPWQKRKHWQRRVISPINLKHCQRILKPKKNLVIATDDDTYSAWIIRHIKNDWHWNPLSWNIPPIGWEMTKYQKKALLVGRQTVYFNLVSK